MIPENFNCQEQVQHYSTPDLAEGPSAIGASSTSPSYTNPKRKAAADSLSLRHGNMQGSGTVPNQTNTVPPRLRHAPPNPDVATHILQTPSSYDTTVQTTLGSGIMDSHQSRDADVSSADTSIESLQTSNPDDWYDAWDKRAGEINDTAIRDDDPPYFQPVTRGRSNRVRGNPGRPTLKNRDSELSSKLGDSSGYSSTESQMILDNLPASAENSLFPFLLPDNKNDDDFRDVIDDLTIKNKKLKQKLRKMERIHCGDMDEEKMFEVRFHGLSASKKMELEELLRQFASKLNEPELGPATNYIPGSAHAHDLKLSARISIQQTDSAYATETVPGERSGAQSTTPSSRMLAQSGSITKKMASANMPTSVRFNPMTQEPNERTKMKLVVRKLEELFTGRIASNSLVSSSLQQQDVSNLAAQDDRRGNMNMGIDRVNEGTREAALMTWQEDSAMTTAEDASRNLESPVTDSGGEADSIADQRPTRPIDLDPQRAQIPAENLEYLNHVTSSSMQKYPPPRVMNEDEVSDWVYLNLITNLAQLHTLNVSLPFIKRAIESMSTKLELSSDEKKIRWKGGNVGSKLSSDSDSGNNSPDTPSLGASSSERDGNKTKVKRPPNITMLSNLDSGFSMPSSFETKRKSASLSGAFKKRCPSRSETGGASSEKLSKSTATRLRNAAHEKFHYTPIFGTPRPAVKRGSSDSDCSMSSAEQSSSSELGGVDNDGWSGKGLARDGPVIFFGGAQFCTDLSAQILLDGMPQTSGPSYNRFVEKPLGPSRPASQHSHSQSDRPLFVADWRAEDSAMDVDAELIDFASMASDHAASTSSPEPLEFDFSGLGGTRPDDNFMIHVRTRRTAIYPSGASSQEARVEKVRHTIPKSYLNVFLDGTGMSPKNAKYSQAVVSVDTTKLAPSKLPSPSYVFLTTSDDSSMATDPTTSSAEPNNKFGRQASKELESTDSDNSYQFPIDLDGGCDSDSDGGGWSSGDNGRIELDSVVPMDVLETRTAFYNNDARGIVIPLNPYGSAENGIIMPMNQMFLNQSNDPHFY